VRSPSSIISTSRSSCLKYSAYGYGPARDYFVNHAGSYDDSKVLLAAAHALRHGEQPENTFSGGDKDAAAELRAPGFVVLNRGPDWTWVEIIPKRGASPRWCLDYVCPSRGEPQVGAKDRGHGARRGPGSPRGHIPV
jgi:hypothetical protein